MLTACEIAACLVEPTLTIDLAGEVPSVLTPGLISVPRSPGPVRSSFDAGHA
jgi:hypothetical protein